MSYCVLTSSTHARELATDWTTARRTVPTRRVRYQTRVVPITVSALVPNRTLAQVVGSTVDAYTRSSIFTRRRRAWFHLRQLAVGSRAIWRANTSVPGTI